MNKLEHLLTQIASQTLGTYSQTSRKSNDNKVKWMNSHGYRSQKKLKAYKKDFLSEPSSLDRRQKYLNAKKKHKALMYYLKQAYTTKNLQKVGALAGKSPKEFWRAVKQLQKETKENKADAIPPRVWHNYFHHLLNKQNSAFKHIKNPNTCKNIIGDDDFTITEIENQIVTLKDNKASSTAIINEMIKADTKLIAQTLCHIFNQILAKGIYPNKWNNSNLIPLFKSGDCTDPADYRGISIGNPISKIFAKCLNARLQNHLENNRILPDNAMGFRKNIRTEDAMFTLKNIISGAQKRNSKLHTDS